MANFDVNQRWSNLSVVLISVFVAASCGGDGQGDLHETTASIHRGNGGIPGSLDPALAEDVHAFNILTDIYEGLVTVAADGSLIPGVARDWAVSGDGLHYAFYLRDDARWSNGDPIVADDFVKSLRRAADPATTTTYGFLLGNIRYFDEVASGSLPADRLAVVAQSSQVLEIELQERTPYFFALLSMPVAMPVHSSNRGHAVSLTPQARIGNGAFRLDSVELGGDIKVSKNPFYWDADKVAIDEVIYSPITDLRLEFAMYRAGQLDITQSVPPQQIAQAQKEFATDLQIAPSLGLYYLAFDLTEPPLDNVELRQALNMAVDREQLVDLIGRGEQAAYGIVPPGVANHDTALFDWHDLAPGEREQQAISHYRDAGYDDKHPLRIQLTYDTGDIHEKVALVIAAMWRDVLGVDVQLRKMEWQLFLDTRDNRSEWQVMRFAWIGDYDDATTFTNIFRSNDPQNLPAYANREFDRLLAEADQQSDSQVRSQLLSQAESVLLQDYPVAPLYFFVSKHMVRPQISGFEHNPLDRHPSRFLSVSPDD